MKYLFNHTENNPLVIGNCHNLYKTEKGEYYTRGIAGWINVSKYVK